MKILSILGMDKESRNQKQIQRKAKALKRNQERLIDNLEERKDNLVAKQENLLNINVDSVTDSWNEQFQNITVELQLMEKQIEIANQTMATYFTDEEKSEKASS